MQVLYLSETEQEDHKYVEENEGKMNRYLSKIVVVAGTNASGKSSLAIDLAKKYGGELVSADSRQVYKGFDLCSGKVTKEERAQIPHHLLDVCNIEKPYSAADYQKAAYAVIDQIIQRGHIPFLVGGTGLYISSVVHGYDFQEETIDAAYRNELEKKSLKELQDMLSEEAREVLSENNSDRNNKRRLIRLLEKTRNGEKLTAQNCPRYKTLQLGVTWEKSILHRRIDKRLRQRLDQGMIEEVRSYLEVGNSPEYLYRLGLEYRCIADYLDGKYSSFEEFYNHLSQAIKRFAKRQMTWFKKDTTIHWLNMEQGYFEQACALISLFI